MNRYVLSIILLFTVGQGVSFAQGGRVSFYFSAHPDDWQLFMGVNAFRDIAAASTGSSNKVVFVYTTAGEANCGSTGVDKNYYLSRQEGANRSVQFCSDIYSPHATWSSSVITIQGITTHNILQLTYKNIVCYLLRLPDGCLEGTPISMTKFANGANSSLSAVDSSTTYHGYEDLVETVKNLVDYERSTLNQPEVWLHASDWDQTVNFEDHPDHLQTGRLVTQVAGRVNYANLMLHEGYYTCNRPSNLTPEEIAMEASLQSQVSFAQTHNGWPSEWDPASSCGHVDWTNKNYYRVVSTAANPTQSTGFLTLEPNPTRSTLNVTYKVMESGRVNIVMYDMAGNLKASIVNENDNMGVYTVKFDVSGFPQGNYIINAKTPGHLDTLKFTKI